MKRWIKLGTAVVLALGLGCHAYPADEPPAQDDVLISVGDHRITGKEYELALRQAMRQKFYHGKPPQDQVRALQQEVAEQMADRVLLKAEAQRRGIVADREKIQETLRGYDERYKDNANYQKNRDQMLAGIAAQLEERDVLAKLEKTVRDVPTPSESEVRRFYDANKSLFIEPEKLKLSLILIAVDPGSPQAEWDASLVRAREIYEKLKGGADFAKLAIANSGDRSAESGGDMGYVHRGMLAENVQERMDKAKPGEIIEPITMLEGHSIFRVDDRIEPQLRSFDDVKGRATELLRRENGEAAWKALVQGLRKDTPVKIDQARLAEIVDRMKL